MCIETTYNTYGKKEKGWRGEGGRRGTKEKE